MNKATKVTYEGGMNQDITKSKHPPNFYFEGRNIRIVATDSQSTGAVTNEKGNSFILTIPTVTINSNTRKIEYITNIPSDVLNHITYSIPGNFTKPRNEIEEHFNITEGNPIVISGEQIIIGTGRVRDYFILFTTDNQGFDCIWRLRESDFKLELLYIRNLGFHTNRPIQIIGNFENEKVDKIYWVDGKYQLRFLNTLHSIENGDNEELIDMSSTLINQVSNVELNQPQIIDKVFGGIHTAGMIQYAYNLYNTGGSQTTISPISELVSLDKGDGNGGGDVNEIVGSIPIIKILDIDPKYNNIQIYSIKYTSLNQIPSISLLVDSEIPQNKEFTHYDDGNIIQTISLEEFVFLGAATLIPNHIESKDNRLFLANYKEENFDVDIDTRAYSFNSEGVAKIADNFTVDDSNQITPVTELTLTTPTPLYTSIPEKYSAINIDYNTYKYDVSGINLGGEGKYIKYNIIRSTLDQPQKHFKDGEIYRIGIEFYNNKGQYSVPKWIADFKVNSKNQNDLNLIRKYSGLEVTLKSEFYTWLNDNNNFLNEDGVFDESLKPVGYKILRADRQLKDRTILFQGIINPTISLSISDSNHGDTGYEDLVPPPAQNIIEADEGLKMPSLMRRFDDFLVPQRKANGYAKLNPRGHYTHPQIIPGFSDDGRSREVRKGASGSSRVANYYQYNQMMQLFSPEILFNDISQISATQLKIIGSLDNSYNAFWGQERDIFTQEVIVEAKAFGVISPHDVKTLTSGSRVEIEGSINDIVDHGYIASTASNPQADKLMVFNQLYREYSTNFFSRAAGPLTYNFYGNPIITEKGQGRTTYNNDSNFIFSNSWESIITDGGTAKPLKSVNSWGARSLTFVLGDSTVNPNLRTRIEQIFQNGFNTGSDALVGEVTIPEYLIYVGGIYGGNSYESKRRTNYIGIGNYQSIDENINTIISPGDTFIEKFKFLKLSKTDTEIYSNNVAQFTEIVEFRVETSVDLKNRNDQSFTDWDNRFQPRADEYHKYNRVYSQQPSLQIKRDFEFNFKRINNYDTNVTATLLKSPGERIDSWTKTLPNEVLTLDGKHGAINSLVNFRDQIFTLQDNALCFLSINPRVQVQASDGISVELGHGAVLQEYKYVSTESGTKDKWSVLSTPNAFYYFDNYNKALKIFREGDVKLSTIKGLKTYFNNNSTFGKSAFKPNVNKDTSTGYDYLNDEAIFTFITNNNPFTLVFNENLGVFTSFYDYKPSFWISRGNHLLATTVNNKSIYKQFAGEYNNFFGEYHPSYITLMINPEADLDCVFDNIMYKSELYLNNIDQPDKTLSHIQAFNEYQNSGLIPLELGRNKNLRRKFRNWHALIPRESRNRIRNPWIYLKLQLTNEDNYKMILHDVNIFYTI